MAEEQTKKLCRFWIWALSSSVFRLVLISFPENLNLSSRPEVSTPLTSIRRLAEGYWLKQASMSPYAGSMYHGSPLLLSVLGPLTVQRIEGQPSHLLCSLVFVIADILSAILLRGIGQKLQMAYGLNARLLGLAKLSRDQVTLPCGDIAALVYLWNPFTIVSCVGLSTSPIENLAVILALFGAVTRRVPLAAFGLVIATHLSLYPATLAIPIIILLGYGLDAPPIKLFLRTSTVENEGSSTSTVTKQAKLKRTTPLPFLWKTVIHFLFWVLLWSLCVLVLCALSLSKYGGLEEMFKRTYGFILSIEDLSPNIGVFWYFFAEVFDFFRNFFLIVFHVNILFMLLPLAIRLKHRPCFLAFIYLAISSILKSYPSVGDSALYLSLWALFVNELVDMKFSFFLFCGYLGISLLSPVMHNLWIWRGTGNANFYFGNAIGYACFQELKKEGTLLTEEIALDLMFVMLFSSFETASFSLTLAIKFLSENPSILKGLTEEHEEILRNREDADSGLTWKEYKSMTYTFQFINETARLANLAPVIFRKALKDTQYEGYIIPTGWAVMVCPPAIHLNPELYEDPLVFNPSRC